MAGVQAADSRPVAGPPRPSDTGGLASDGQSGREAGGRPPGSFLSAAHSTAPLDTWLPQARLDTSPSPSGAPLHGDVWQFHRAAPGHDAPAQRRPNRFGTSGSGRPRHSSEGAAAGTEKWRRHVRLMLEDPSSSREAALAQFVLISGIVLSVCCAIVETVPTLKGHIIFVISEPIFTALFSVEIAARLWTCNNYRRFFGNCFNVIDIIATAPGYTDLIFWPLLRLESTKERERVENLSGSMWTLRVIRMVRMIRLLRVLRLAKAEAITVVVESVRGSLNGLYVLVVFVFLGSIVSATACYLSEVEIPGTSFVSIPASFWWATSTILAVGYGDMVPQTLLGKVVGTFTMLGGTTILAVCIAVITTSFMETYQRNLYLARMRKLQTQAQKTWLRKGQEIMSDSEAEQNFDRRHADATTQHHPSAGNGGAQGGGQGAYQCERPAADASEPWKNLVSLAAEDIEGEADDDIDLASCVNELEELTEVLILRFEALADRAGLDVDVPCADVGGTGDQPALGQGGPAAAGERRYTSLIVNILRKNSKLWFEQLRGFSEELLRSATACSEAHGALDAE